MWSVPRQPAELNRNTATLILDRSESTLPTERTVITGSIGGCVAPTSVLDVLQKKNILSSVQGFKPNTIQSAVQSLYRLFPLHPEKNRHYRLHQRLCSHHICSGSLEKTEYSLVWTGIQTQHSSARSTVTTQTAPPPPPKKPPLPRYSRAVLRVVRAVLAGGGGGAVFVVTV